MMNSSLDPSLSSSNQSWWGWSAGDPSAPFCLLEATAGSGNACLLEISVIFILAVLIISGNLVVIVVFHCVPSAALGQGGQQGGPEQQHATSTAFIRTMAYADLLVGISCLFPPLSLLRQRGDDAGGGLVPFLDPGTTCRAFAYLVSVLKAVSMVSLACVSADRYVAVTRPLAYARLATPGRVRGAVAAAWLYSAAVFAPCFAPGWGGKPGYHGDVARPCAAGWSTRPAFTALVVAALYAPAALTVCFAYGSIFRICRRHTREMSERRARYGPQRDAAGDVAAAVERGEASPPVDAKARQTPPPPCPDKRYAMVLFRITSVFYALWLPYILYFLLESGGVYRHHAASFLTTWLAISNSFCNCLIYSLSNSAFREGLKRLCSFFCLRRGHRRSAGGGGGLALDASAKTKKEAAFVIERDFRESGGCSHRELEGGITCGV